METAMLIAILSPICGAFLLPLFSRFSTKLRNFLAFFLVVFSLGASISLIKPVLAGQTIQLRYAVPFGLDLIFRADVLGVFMALASTFIGLIIVFYSLGYIHHDTHQNEYYLMVVLFLGSMVGLVYSQSLIYIYLFWEIAAICCWRLIGFYRDPDTLLRADKAFLMTVFGAIAMLFGFIMIYGRYHSFDLHLLRGKEVSNLAMLLIMFGIFSKSATLPFHTWLPDAGVAPSPVTALLHAAVLVKIGVFAFARIFVGTMTYPPIWNQILPIVISLSAIVAGGAALVETNIKRIIAYSTISQLAFIFLGLFMFKFNNSYNSLAIAGGLLFILMHGISKAGLFLCAGIIEHNVHTKDIRQMGGLMKSMPLTAISFALCALSVMGIPPFGGFFSKYMVIAGAVKSGRPWIAGVFIFGAFLTVLYLLRLFVLVFFGEPKLPLVKEGTRTMVIAVILLGILSLVSGFLVRFPNEFIQVAVRQMVGY
ncbi:MAG TPA: NADH-quinone oxidoreductase subunit L [Bacillota bacterium]|nr:NADH-quinone oxidoreductase subunit L [Bacillota bacterium]